MERVDVAELLRRYIADGFPMGVLSNITRISEDALTGIGCGKSRYDAGVDSDRFCYLVMFLATLYAPFPDVSEYFQELVDDLTTYFGIPFPTVAVYAGVTEDELRQFLAAPLCHPQQVEPGMRIFHLFSQFARDPRFSLERVDFG